MDFLLGIDVGTTGIKSILINRQGEIVSTSTVEYPLSIPQPNWAEQNPEDWWKSTGKAVKQLLRSTGIPAGGIKGVGLSGQMHGLVLLDDKCNVLRPCILWCDQRTDKECDYVTKTVGKKKLIELTCNPALTGFTIGKLLWVRNNEPQVYKKIRYVLLPKDYIRFKLTGEFATDVSDASGTLFLSVPQRKWSSELLSCLDLPLEWLPKCYESTEVTGKISNPAAAVTGLSAGTIVVAGGGDQASQAVGTGIVNSGIISVTLGTSGVVFAYSDTPKLDPKGRLHTFCHSVPGKWHLMGVMLSAGGSLRWFRDAFCQEEIALAKLKKVDPYVLITEKAAKVPPGCDGLVFLPYLSGERTPHADPYARGVFFGLTLRHTRLHLVRSIMEGVAFGLRDSFELIRKLNVPIKEVRITGGGARSELWKSIIATVLNTELVTINNTEGAAYGAALLAGVGAGVYDSVNSACQQTIKVQTHTSPIPSLSKIYDKMYDIYTSLYPAVKETYKKL